MRAAVGRRDHRHRARQAAAAAATSSSCSRSRSRSTAGRGIYAIAGDTDGVDGQEEIAGAIVTPDTLARAWAKGIKPRDRLADNDGHGFFEALGDSVVTGPTLTNVNDFRAILVLRAQRWRFVMLLLMSRRGWGRSPAAGCGVGR